MAEAETLSLAITVITLLAASIFLVLNMVKAMRNDRNHGLVDFRLHLLLVAFVWLVGESAALFLGSELGTTLHFVSMVLYAAFMVIRIQYLLEKSPK